jgi:hypothetical protein
MMMMMIFIIDFIIKIISLLLLLVIHPRGAYNAPTRDLVCVELFCCLAVSCFIVNIVALSY